MKRPWYAWALSVGIFSWLVFFLFRIGPGPGVRSIRPAGGLLRAPDWTCYLSQGAGLTCENGGWAGLVVRVLLAAGVALLPLILWDR